MSDLCEPEDICYHYSDPLDAKFSTLWVIWEHVVCRLLCTRTSSFCTILYFIQPPVDGKSPMFCGETRPPEAG